MCLRPAPLLDCTCYSCYPASRIQIKNSHSASLLRQCQEAAQVLCLFIFNVTTFWLHDALGQKRIWAIRRITIQEGDFFFFFKFAFWLLSCSKQETGNEYSTRMFAEPFDFLLEMPTLNLKFQLYLRWHFYVDFAWNHNIVSLLSKFPLLTWHSRLYFPKRNKLYYCNFILNQNILFWNPSDWGFWLSCFHHGPNDNDIKIQIFPFFFLLLWLLVRKIVHPSIWQSGGCISSKSLSAHSLTKRRCERMNTLITAIMAATISLLQYVGCINARGTARACVRRTNDTMASQAPESLCRRALLV